MRVFALTLAALACLPLAARAQTPEERLAAASALFDAKKYAEAAQRLDSFLAVVPKHAKAGAAALVLGRCRAELKQWPLTVAAYEKAAAAGDPSVLQPAQLGLGEAAMYTHQYDKAVTALEAATKGDLKPEQAPYAWFWLGQANYELKRYAASEDAYVHVTRSFANSDFVDGAYFGSGLAALKQGKTDVARQRFRTVVDRFRNSEDRPRAMVILGQIDLEAKRFGDARQSFEAAVAEKLTPELQRSAEDGLIKSLLELQDYAAAIPRLESALQRMTPADPQRFRAELSLGHCRYRQKQYDSALQSYMGAAKSTEDAVAVEGSYWAANALLALDKPAEAAVHFQKVAVRAPKHELAPRAQLKAGDALLAAKHGEAASAAYRVVLDKYPQSPQASEAKKALAEVVDSITDPAQLATALKTAPLAERERGTIRLAHLYLRQKRYSDVQSAIAELLKAKPKSEIAGEANYLLGLAFDAQQKDSAAAVALTEAVRLSPEAAWVSDAQGRLAWVYLAIKQPANAEKSAQAVLNLKPDTAAEQQARLAMLQAQVDLQKWDLAQETCRTILGANPSQENIPTVLFTQAWIAEKQRKPEDALPIWEKLAADFPKHRYAADALLHLGDSLLKAEKYEEASDKYSSLLSGFPRSPLAAEARFKLGSALFNSGKAAEAAKEFDTVAVDKSSAALIPEALYWAGVAFDKSGKKDEAIARLEKVVAQFPAHARVANAKVRLAALKAVTGK